MMNLKEYSVILTSFNDMNQKIRIKIPLLPKFQLIPILCKQVTHDYVH